VKFGRVVFRNLNSGRPALTLRAAAAGNTDQVGGGGGGRE